MSVACGAVVCRGCERHTATPFACHARALHAVCVHTRNSLHMPKFWGELAFLLDKGAQCRGAGEYLYRGVVGRRTLCGAARAHVRDGLEVCVPNTEIAAARAAAHFGRHCGR